MSEPGFEFRGLRIALGGFAIAAVAIGLGRLAFGAAFPNWLVLLIGLAGIALGWAGGALHYVDMMRLRRDEAEAQKAWIRRHGDPDRRDDPADRGVP